jgi:hypothetical protein
MPVTIFNPASYRQFQGSGLQVYNPPPPIGIVTSGIRVILAEARKI